MQELLAHNDKLHAALPAPPEADDDIEDLREELPPALTRVADGLSRIAEIVRSMKDFSHADQREMSAVDLNRAIDSTLVIARSEYKYVADVETDFRELPPVTCHGGQINQVVLNLVVNAAHAIARQGQGHAGQGHDHREDLRRRRIRGHQRSATRAAAFPEAIRARIFDPFFTTKEVGEAPARASRSRTT